MKNALDRNERKETLRAACKSFKEHNNIWEEIKCVMADKAATEIALFKEEFPRSLLRLCHFYVQKALWTEFGKAKHGFSSFANNCLKAAFTGLMYARSIECHNSVATHIRAVVNEPNSG